MLRARFVSIDKPDRKSVTRITAAATDGAVVQIEISRSQRAALATELLLQVAAEDDDAS
jgi:hypothetical protein